eukprot:6186956-Pleurochrysis_carterae.AAC.2
MSPQVRPRASCNHAASFCASDNEHNGPVSHVQSNVACCRVSLPKYLPKLMWTLFMKLSMPPVVNAVLTA